MTLVSIEAEMINTEAGVIVVVVVVNFISGLLNSINNKENNSKPDKGQSDKTIYVKTCTRKENNW